MRVSGRAFRHERDLLESVRQQTLAHPRRRMERRAEVRARAPRPSARRARRPESAGARPRRAARGSARRASSARRSRRGATTRCSSSIHSCWIASGRCVSTESAYASSNDSSANASGGERPFVSKRANGEVARGTSRSRRPRGRCPAIVASSLAQLRITRPQPQPKSRIDAIDSMPRSRALERVADRLAPRAGRSRGTTRRRAFPRRARSGARGGTGRPSAAAGSGACGIRAARTRSYARYVGREQARTPEQTEERVLHPRARAYTEPMAQAPALPRGFELPLEPRLPAHRLRRPGRGRGARGRAREALDQARGEALRARARDPLHGSDDARGSGHAGQGRGALLEGGASRPDRPAHPFGRGGVRLSEPRSRRGRAAARERREGRVGRDRVPVRAVAARGEARRGALGRRAGRGRGRHGDRPRRVPLGALREGLRRDRAREGSVRRRAPEGDPRDRRARHVRQRAPREPARDGGRRRLHQDVDRASCRAPRRCRSRS